MNPKTMRSRPTRYDNAPFPVASVPRAAQRSVLGFTNQLRIGLNAMKPVQALVWFATLVIFNTSAVAQVKATVECMVSGTKATGERSTKQFVERIQIESRKHTVTGKDGNPEEWGIRKVELISDGQKQEPRLIVAVAEYAVLAHAVTVGTGFERRLLVFTYMLDLKAMQLTRVVNSLPASTEERTSAACRQK